MSKWGPVTDLGVFRRPLAKELQRMVDTFCSGIQHFGWVGPGGGAVLVMLLRCAVDAGASVGLF